jgi:hypothetical protein
MCAALALGYIVATPGSAFAQTDCTPHCDFNHYYGPSDYTYVRPGLFGYPRCGPRGNCSPNLVYGYSDVASNYATFISGAFVRNYDAGGYRIVVRPRKRARGAR